MRHTKHLTFPPSNLLVFSSYLRSFFQGVQSVRIPIALFILMFASVTYAGGIKTVIDLPAETSQPGHSMVFSVFCLNQCDIFLVVLAQNFFFLSYFYL